MKTEKIKSGTKFVVCDHKELTKKGWLLYSGNYTHKNYGLGGIITFDMIEKCQGQIFTVTEESKIFPTWFWVSQNPCLWPVDQFKIIEPDIMINADICLFPCEEGMTPIDGWFICKHCGTNLKEIR